MKTLWEAVRDALENICRSAEFCGLNAATSPAIIGMARRPTENGAMLDILMLAIGLGFFVLLVLYGLASERL